MFEVPALPYWTPPAEQFIHALGRSTAEALHVVIDGARLKDSEENVHVIRHGDRSDKFGAVCLTVERGKAGKHRVCDHSLSKQRKAFVRTRRYKIRRPRKRDAPATQGSVTAIDI